MERTFRLEELNKMEIEFFADPGRCKTLLPPVPASQAMPTWWYQAQGTFMDETEEYWREAGNQQMGLLNVANHSQML